jgi:Spy/CpxP family protein refolding chaperone
LRAKELLQEVIKMVTKIRKSIRVLVAAGALVVGGFWTGRLMAGPLWGQLGFAAAAHFGHIANHFDHIANWLALSDLQKTEVKRVVRSHGEEILSQIQSQIAMREALGEVIMAGTVDEGLIRQRAEALGRVETEGALLRARIHSEIWPILNDEQRAKVASFHQMMELKHDMLLGSVQDFLK